MRDRVFIPHLQIRPHALILYGIPDPPFQHKRTTNAPKYTGVVTASASKRIKRAVDILLQMSPVKKVWNPITQAECSFRLTFVTLTISKNEVVMGREGYKEGLGKFLDWLRKKGTDLYIWKAEFQKRGQLHYHITTNIFIRHDELRNKWNSLQRAAGWLNDFREKKGHWNPNSTDIHAVRKIKRLDLYLAKYMAKGDPSKAIEGKVWGCSQRLMGKRYFSSVLEQENIRNMDLMQEKKRGRVLKLEHCTIFDTATPNQVFTVKQKSDFANWLTS